MDLLLSSPGSVDVRALLKWNSPGTPPSFLPGDLYHLVAGQTVGSTCQGLFRCLLLCELSGEVAGKSYDPVRKQMNPSAPERNSFVEKEQRSNDVHSQ